jgi:hypothetical protein
LLVVSYNNSKARQIIVAGVNATSITSITTGIKGYKVRFCGAGYGVVCRVSCRVASRIS